MKNDRKILERGLYADICRRGLCSGEGVPTPKSTATFTLIGQVHTRVEFRGAACYGV